MQWSMASTTGCAIVTSQLWIVGCSLGMINWKCKKIKRTKFSGLSVGGCHPWIISKLSVFLWEHPLKHNYGWQLWSNYRLWEVAAHTRELADLSPLSSASTAWSQFSFRKRKKGVKRLKREKKKDWKEKVLVLKKGRYCCWVERVERGE